MWTLDGNLLREFQGHTDRIFSIAFSPDGKTILTGSEDATARLWGLDGNMIMEFKGHKGDVRSVAFSPDGKTILTGSADNTARLWNVPMLFADFLKSNKLEPLSAEQKKEFGIK
jgi:WD40 repeat protein